MSTGIYVRTKPNSGQFKKGQTSWNKGKKMSEESRKKMSLAKIGKPSPTKGIKRPDLSIANKNRKWSKKDREKHSDVHKGERNQNWKGDKVGYDALHDWVKRKKGKAKQCVHCGTKDAKRYEWSNIDHKYRRNVDDFIELCTKCHYKYHKDNNLRANYGFIK